MNNFFKTSWLYLLINGIIAIAIGLAFIFFTKEIFTMIIRIFGALIIISASILIWRSLANSVNRNYFILLEGILLMAIGIYMTATPAAMVKFILTFFGLWAMIAGGFELFYGVRSADFVKGNKVLIINGLILFFVGLVMVFKHDLFYNVIGAILGWINLLIGVITIYYALAFRRSIKVVEPQFSDDDDTGAELID